MLIYKDGLNARGHKFRKNDYEKLLGVANYPERKLPFLWKIQGYHITILGLIIVNIFNILILFEYLVASEVECSVKIVGVSAYLVGIGCYFLLLIPKRKD
jgi:hypothetical protein